MDDNLKNSYFAGLIDGEGNIKIYSYAAGHKRPVIKVHMTCKKTIMALHQHFGGHMGSKKIEQIPNRKPQWYWAVTFKKALEVAKTLQPYIITKSDEIRSIIEHYNK